MGLLQIMGLMQDRAWDTNSQNILIPSSFTSHEELENFVPLKMDGNDSVWEESMAHGTLLIKVASSRIISTEILRCPPRTLGENFKCIWRAPHLCKYPSVERGLILCLLLDRCKNPPTPIELVSKDSHHSTPCALPIFRFVWGSPHGFWWVKLVGARHFQSITHPHSQPPPHP